MSSEKLGHHNNVLKGDLGGGFDILTGSTGEQTDLGIARRFGSAAAAYSLRDIGAVGRRVVKVRRDSGETTDPEEDFSANQVQSGALEDWVNGKLESTLPADVATAAAAYSLRKVKASYSGEAVRIRRSSDDVEVDVAFDSDDKVSSSSSISTVSGSTTATTLGDFINGTDAFVHTWYDQAGSNDAVQETAGNQPKIAENGALLTDANGFTKIQFTPDSNSGKYLDTSSDLVLGASLSLFFKANLDSSSSGARALSKDNSFANLIMVNTSDIRFQYNRGTTVFTLLSNLNVRDSEALHTIISDGSNLKGHQNGGSAETDSFSNASDFTINRIGSSSNSGSASKAEFSTSELVLFNTDQSDNRFKIESNINNYYGLYNDANEFSGNPTAEVTPSAITLTNVSKTGFTAEISATSGTKQINFPLLNSLVSGDDYFVSFDYTSTNTSNTVGVKPRTAALGSASNDVISATNSGFYGGTGDAAHNGFDVNNTATVLSFQTTAQSFTFTVSNLRVSRIARNGFVETWYDQSGNGNNATQSSAGNQPTIISNGNQVTLDNGTPSVAFKRPDGQSSDTMSISTPIANEPYTFFATTVNNADNAWFRLFGESNAAPTVLLQNSNQINYNPSDSDSSGAISAATTSDNIVSGFSGVNGGADGILRFNGTNLKTDISRTQDGDSISLVGRFPNTGAGFAYIESLVFYESDLTADFDTIEKELAQPINIL